MVYIYIYIYLFIYLGLRENLQENPIFDGKNHGFRLGFSQQNLARQSTQVAASPKEVAPCGRCKPWLRRCRGTGGPTAMARRYLTQ